MLLCLNFTAWSTHPVEPLPNPENTPQSWPTTNKPPRILLVSALFPLTRAKHSHEDYISWLKNLVGPDGIQSDLYFYTTTELADLVSSSTSSYVPRARLTINTTYTSPFSVPPLTPYASKYHAMHAWDREHAIHSPELYAVWNAKPWLLEHALISLSRSEQEYDYAFWVDAGSFRAPHPFRQWPDPRRVEEVLLTSDSEQNKDKILIPLYNVPGLIEYKWRLEMGPVDMDLSEGTFFGSTPAGISWFSKTFYETHDWYITTSPPIPPSSPFPGLLFNLMKGNIASDETRFHFVGKDQTLINTMFFRYPERFVGLLRPGKVALLPPVSSPSSTSSPSDPPSKEPDPQSQPNLTPHILTLPSILTRISHTLSSSISFPFSLSFSRSFSLSWTRTKKCGDWYFYQWFLASAREREEAREAGWDGCPRVHMSVSAGVSSDGRGREGREVVDVEEMLKGLFGRRWVEGRRAGGA